MAKRNGTEGYKNAKKSATAGKTTGENKKLLLGPSGKPLRGLDGKLIKIPLNSKPKGTPRSSKRSEPSTASRSVAELAKTAQAIGELGGNGGATITQAEDSSVGLLRQKESEPSAQAERRPEASMKLAHSNPLLVLPWNHDKFVETPDE